MDKKEARKLFKKGTHQIEADCEQNDIFHFIVGSYYKTQENRYWARKNHNYPKIIIKLSEITDEEMSKTKLTPEQKEYLKLIDSKKTRKGMKEAFLTCNKSGYVWEPVVLNFEFAPSQPIEELEKGIMYKGKAYVNDKNTIDFRGFFNGEYYVKEFNKTTPPSLPKEILREVTEPKNALEKDHDAFIDSTKKYTQEDMMKCFKSARLTTHPITACFSHESFAAYLNSLEQ